MDLMKKIKGLFNKEKSSENTNVVVDDFIRNVVTNLGGIDNITGFNNGVTRLRYDVKNSSLVNSEELKKLGAEEVLVLGPRYVEVKFGDQSEFINSQIRLAQPVLKKELAKNAHLQEGNLASKAVLSDTSEVQAESVDKVKVLAPAAGAVMPLESLNDGVFSEKMLGEGFVIDISHEKSVDVLSPISGKVVLAFPTKHAYTIVDSHGTEVMVHVGINTVKNGGLGFEAHVVQGQEIKAGDKLVTVDVARLVSEKLNPNVILVVTNDSQFKEITNLAREVKPKDVICVLKK